MEALKGKLLIVAGWIFAAISGQIICYALSAIASVLAIIYWSIKIKKEIKK